MNSFIENVNYVANLDNKYGSSIEIYKNNLSLRTELHDIELKFSYYNNDDKKIHSIVHSEPGVLVGGINDTLLSFKTFVESSITGSEFTCVVSSGVQNFVINNIVMVSINITSNSNMYKTYELEMKVVTAGAVTYDVFGEVKDSLKILPSLAMITASDIDVIANVYEIQEEVITVSENIAKVETVSDSIANVNTVGISISNVNIVGEDIANVNTVASNIVGLNSIVSNMTEILLADDNAAIATTKALESSDSADASAQSALDSAANAALFPNHIADITNPHGVTKAQVGLELAENTADIDKIVASAGKLTAPVNISLSGDASGSVSFDGSANVDVVVTVGNDTHTHAFVNITGKPTTIAGYGITDADTSAQVTTKINNAVAALVDASPTTLDTLNELAAALGDDPNFATTTSTALGNRVIKNADIVAGTGTKVTYDAKGLVTASTTPTTLAGYSIGDAYTKAEADALHDSLAVASAGQSVSYFLDNVITPGGNYALTNSPDGDPETTIAKIAVAANTPYFMERYISDPIGGTTIDGGLWVFRTYARVSSDVGTSEIVSRINKRTIKSGTVTITGTGTSRTITSSDPIFVFEDANSSILNATLIETPTETFWISAFTSATQVTAITDNSGYINETSVSIHMYYKLFEATTGDINGNTAKLYETKSIQPSFNIVPTDSILIAYFAITTSTNKTLTLYKGGTVNYSHIVTPIVYRHNSLKGLNEGEFQHLTAAQLAKINAISGTNTGDQDLSGKADVATTLSGYGITDAYTKIEVQTVLPKVGFDTTNVVVPGIGQVAWNHDENTLDLGLNGAVLQVGQEHLIRVRNNTVSTITNGSAVMATGTIGNSGRITIGNANLTQTNAKYILGIVTENIISGADGFVTAFGKVRGIQTNGVQFGETWVDGDVIYVKDSGNGALTKVVPTDTQVKLPIAIVVHAHASNGTLFVRVNSIDENHAKAELALKADKSEIANVNLLRADKYLASQNIAAMMYTAGDLTKIQYNTATDVNYEVLNYTSGNLTSISHYVESVLKGTTTLNYSSGNLVSVIFVGV